MEHIVCAEADLAEGTMRAVEVAGTKVLLTRVGGVCHAVSATCPHAGGPLAEGVLNGGVVICPWHKAAFRVDTGALVEPPALDSLARYSARVVDGQVSVSLDETVPSSSVAGSDPRVMVVVGTGAAGAMAAQTLREEGFAGRVVLVGHEDRLPYDRTVLSKYALSGKPGAEKTPLQDAEFYAHHRIERMAREVVAIDPEARTVTFADGDDLTYDAALLATGGTPRRPTLPGTDLPGVFLLRSAADAEAIVAAAENARRVVVLGAGFIAIEAAGALRERGLEVAVVAPQQAPFEKQLGPDVGGAFRRVHEREGVVFHLGEEVAAIEGEARVSGVRLKSGVVLEADLVVIGMGVVPVTDMLVDVVLRPDQGVDVSSGLLVADTLYAAGDIAAFPLRGGGEQVRVEHWRVAEQHGRVAARNMLGGAAIYDAVPYFWTIHYMKRLDYVGHAESWDEVEIDGDLETPDFTAFYVQGGIVTAVAGWGRDLPMARAIDLLTHRRDWPVDELRAALATG